MTSYQEVSDPRYHYLKAFQSQRLATTYEDFTAQKEYRAACHFFFNRLYSTEDTADRDDAFRKIHKSAKRFLGGSVVTSMEKLIELQELTINLDERILAVLAQWQAPCEFDLATYERAYQASDNYTARIRQIELLEFTNHLIHKISHRFGIGTILKGLRAACAIRGDTRMADFLMEGYRAFADIKSIAPLVNAIGDRERTRLDRIYALPKETAT